MDTLPTISEADAKRLHALELEASTLRAAAQVAVKRAELAGLELAQAVLAVLRSHGLGAAHEIDDETGQIRRAPKGPTP